jgi:hypothetical protein
MSDWIAGFEAGEVSKEKELKQYFDGDLKGLIQDLSCYGDWCGKSPSGNLCEACKVKDAADRFFM